MGGVVSPGRNNDELVDNLCKGGYIVTPEVERVFRILDRKDYMVFSDKEDAYLEAYEDHAWKKGNLHLSAPCIYTKAMESMNISPGQSFLNLGSGTGYLSTMVGLLLGPSGINHGIEIYQDNIEFANEILNKFKDESPWYDPVQFCEPSFIVGNALLLSSNGIVYDRIYCGAACPPEHVQLLKNMLKINGILILPCESTLEAVSRISEFEWDQSVILSTVSFAPLILPSASSPEDLTAITMVSDVPSLKDISRLKVLSSLTRSNYHQISVLPVPTHLHQYLAYNRTWEPPLSPLKQLCPMTDEERKSMNSGGLIMDNGEDDEEMSDGEQDNVLSNNIDTAGIAASLRYSLPMGGIALLQGLGRREVLQVNLNGMYFQVPIEDSDMSEDADNSSGDHFESESEEQEPKSENDDSSDNEDI